MRKKKVSSTELTADEKAVNFETLRHIESVRNVLNDVIRELMARGESHDQEKMRHPELEYFVEHTHKLSSYAYGSPEYNKSLEELKPALEHHYSLYRHHPEHFPDGMSDMNLIDIIELFCDWKAATSRNKNGNLLKSIETNRTRFRMDDQLVKIFKNTAVMFDKSK